MKYSYAEETGVHVIDYSGEITLEKGLRNLALLEGDLRRLCSGGDALRLLVDMRKTAWKDRETHDALSRAARRIFSRDNLGTAMYAAILNHDFDIPEHGNERWFTDETEAMEWLKAKT